MPATVEFRPYETSDEGLVFDSWLKSFKRSPFQGVIPSNLYYDVYRASIVQLMSRPGFNITVAYYPEMEKPFEVYGYIATETGYDLPTMHYCYVKELYRHRGVSKGLFNAAGIPMGKTFYYTFRTEASAERYPSGLWRPAIVWDKKPSEDGKAPKGRGKLPPGRPMWASPLEKSDKLPLKLRLKVARTESRLRTQAGKRQEARLTKIKRSVEKK